MPYPKFLFYNVLGALLWAVALPLAGFYLGSLIPNADRYLLPIVLVIIIASVMPTVIHIAREKEDRKAIIEGLRKIRARLF